MKANVTKWLKGMLSAAIGGLGNGVAAMAIAQDTFNLNEGLYKLAVMAGLGALIAVGNYLKQSPLPVS